MLSRITAQALDVLAKSKIAEWEQLLHIDQDVLEQMGSFLLKQQNSSSGAFKVATEAGWLDVRLRVRDILACYSTVQYTV